MNYISKNNSKYLLMAHIIFVCKYRKNLLIKLDNDIKYIFTQIEEKYNIQIIEMEVDKNHIHLLIRYPPTKSILEVVRLLKQISTYRIWRLNNNKEYLSKHFWKEQTFWSDGYFACSIGNVSKEIIEQYIRNQG